MPHIIIEYSKNLELHADVEDLVEVMHAAALTIEVFPLGGVRTRAVRRDDYRIADGNVDNCFVDVIVRIGAGRDADTKERIADSLFTALTSALREVYDTTPLALSLELKEISPDFSRKQNNLHDRLGPRSS